MKELNDNFYTFPTQGVVDLIHILKKIRRWTKKILPKVTKSYKKLPKLTKLTKNQQKIGIFYQKNSKKFTKKKLFQYNIPIIAPN